MFYPINRHFTTTLWRLPYAITRCYFSKVMGSLFTGRKPNGFFRNLPVAKKSGDDLADKLIELEKKPDVRMGFSIILTINRKPIIASTYIAELGRTLASVTT